MKLRSASLLAAVVRADALLVDREQDMLRQGAGLRGMSEAAVVAAEAEAEAEADAKLSSTALVASAAAAAAGAEGEGEGGAGTGAPGTVAPGGPPRVIRHPRLLADLATRKERGVEAISTPIGYF